jgi:hypothetical protein
VQLISQRRRIWILRQYSACCGTSFHANQDVHAQLLSKELPLTVIEDEDGVRYLISSSMIIKEVGA